MSISDLLEMGLSLLFVIIILVVFAAGLVAIGEEAERKNGIFYLYPRFYRRNDESYPAPYCPHCGTKLYHNQKFCSECGAGFIWPINKESEELLSEQNR